ncbi:MAG: hypothetical protein J6C16_04665 [Clostridia bacterium]|nr:hypothetical protein [Clostridia bacterium]
MFKLLSAVLILSAGVMVSFEYALEYKKKNKFTEGLISAFEYMSSEIIFEQKFLAKALKSASLYAGVAGEFIESTANCMSTETSAKEAFLSQQTEMSNKVYEILSDYFEQAGMFDAQTEQSRLMAVVERLKYTYEEEKSYIKNTVNQNRKIIIAIAVLICVFIA